MVLSIMYGTPVRRERDVISWLAAFIAFPFLIMQLSNWVNQCRNKACPIG